MKPMQSIWLLAMVASVMRAMVSGFMAVTEKLLMLSFACFSVGLVRANAEVCPALTEANEVFAAFMIQHGWVGMILFGCGYYLVRLWPGPDAGTRPTPARQWHPEPG